MTRVKRLAFAGFCGASLMACAAQPYADDKNLVSCRSEPFTNGLHSRTYIVDDRDIKDFSNLKAYRALFGMGWFGGETRNSCSDAMVAQSTGSALDIKDYEKKLITDPLSSVGAREINDAEVTIEISWLVHDVPGQGNADICLLTPRYKVFFTNNITLPWNGSATNRHIPIYDGGMEWFAPKECVADQLINHTNLQIEFIRKSIAGEVGPVGKWRPSEQ